MGMKALLKKCNQIYTTLPRCDESDEYESCSDCCTRDFYNRPDTYSCLKKLCYYTLNYGPAYSSEIYHYLGKSQLLENHFNGKNLEVLSLGCGFAPDVYALRKYIDDNNLDITYQYTGYDSEENWDQIRESYGNRHYETRDLLDGFSLQGYDLIFMCKAFSTIKRNDRENAQLFLRILKNEIREMQSGSYFIFNDINHINFGRDTFDNAIRSHFSESTHYYFAIDNAYTGDYIKINEIENVFSCPEGLCIQSKPEVTKSIVFEYGK
jgi:hypothetical protein